MTMFLIVGLGNPGAKYEKTRHNIGRMVVERLGARHALGDWGFSKYANAHYLKGEVHGAHLELLLPDTFMNESGKAVKYAVDKHDIEPKNIIVFYDDVDLPFGEVKVSFDRGDGGHNGVKSVANALSTKAFVRIRLGVRHKGLFGVARRPKGDKLSKYVLGAFSGGELKKLDDLADTADNALKLILTEGIEKAMQECNK